MKKAVNVFWALAMFFCITIINEQLFIRQSVLPQFPVGYIREHFWIRMYIHHLGQMLLAAATIVLILKGRLKDYGLNSANSSLSLKYIRWFFLVYGGITVLNFLPNFLAKRPESVGFSPTPFNVLGWFTFQGLMSGTSEEIFFRGLLQTFLGRAWKNSIRILKLEIPAAGIIAAFIYTFAHVEINFKPFALNYNVAQILAAFFLGIFFSIAYDKTKSLLAPIIMHNYANFIMYLFGYVTIILFS